MVFPARAGMIPIAISYTKLSASIPRESGDDPGSTTTPASPSPYSPRERG